MTDDRLRKIAEFYEEKDSTAGLLIFLKSSGDFHFEAGTRIACIPSILQYKIKSLVEDYYEELKEKQKEL